MLCKECKKRESTVHLTQIVNNQKVALDLCQECAEKRGFHNPFLGGIFPLGEMLASVTSGIVEKKAGSGSSAKCPGCGMVFAEFGKVGRFGCGQCYTTFRPQITQMLTRIHGSTQHKGQVPLATKVDLTSEVKKERTLEEQLRQAIAAEDFEKAAKLRDQLKSSAPEKRKKDV
ncbi:MAG: hypothetical protein A2142_06845 [candidate division Zixibacteria bacterium RBG_16_48_11]|nr:MAG: hypothetical protein A2142_06845 [candidate division Zixibacteria bacterium RBG_16_48_11]